jgi:hypothetical protein
VVVDHLPGKIQGHLAVKGLDMQLLIDESMQHGDVTESHQPFGVA